LHRLLQINTFKRSLTVARFVSSQKLPGRLLGPLSAPEVKMTGELNQSLSPRQRLRMNGAVPLSPQYAFVELIRTAIIK
jgi:hypothetical protein